MEGFNYFEQATSLIDSEKDLERIPVRPLGEFSDFIVATLPSHLTAVREGSMSTEDFIAEVETRASDIRLNSFNGSLPLARLDVQLAYNAVVYARTHDGENTVLIPGPCISNIADRLAVVTSRPRTLTYEDVVLDNPRQDMRTLTDGPIRHSEAGFYVAHQIIEGHLELTLQAMRGAIKAMNEGDGGSDTLTDLLEMALVNWEMNSTYTELLRATMPTDHFRIFREYLKGCSDPVSGGILKGASGQQSSRVRETDFLLGGDELGQDLESAYMMDIQNTGPYFPRQGIRNLRDAMRSAQVGQTLRSSAKNVNASGLVLEMIDELAREKVSWRKLHTGAVTTQMNDVLKGTGGEDVTSYLTNMRNDTKNL